MAKWQFNAEDMMKVLQRKGYCLELHITKVGRKHVDILYALLPGRIYGLGRTYRPENTAEAVFSNLIRDKQDSLTPQDFLDSL